jgi:hypothetical protein
MEASCLDAPPSEATGSTETGSDATGSEAMDSEVMGLGALATGAFFFSVAVRGARVGRLGFFPSIGRSDGT